MQMPESGIINFIERVFIVLLLYCEKGTRPGNNVRASYDLNI